MTSGLVRVAALGVAILIATETEAGVLCRQKSGALVMRQSRCRAKEQVVALDVAGPPGPPGKSGAAGPRGLPPTVVDERGNVVGVFLGDHALRHVDDQLLAFPLDDTGFSKQCSLGFASTDCTGPALIMPSYGTVSPGGLASPAVVLDDTAYYVDPALHRLDVHSALACAVPVEFCAGGTFVPPDRCCRSTGAFTAQGFATRTLDLKALGLVPPFHLEGIP